MSTQRREDGCAPATKFNRQGARDRWQRTRFTDRVEGLSQVWFTFLAWFVRAMATVGTAPSSEAAWLPMACFRPSDEALSPGTPERLATDSLQSDHTIKRVRQELRHASRRSPNPRAGFRADFGMPATRRLSLPLIPSPSVLLSLRPSSPNHPAGKRRWTERYDGKRDLHFLNAA
jgi:hypothetical protein